jgi:hypothetical protein
MRAVKASPPTLNVSSSPSFHPRRSRDALLDRELLAARIEPASGGERVVPGRRSMYDRLNSRSTRRFARSSEKSASLTAFRSPR